MSEHDLGEQPVEPGSHTDRRAGDGVRTDRTGRADPGPSGSTCLRAELEPGRGQSRADRRVGHAHGPGPDSPAGEATVACPLGHRRSHRVGRGGPVGCGSVRPRRRVGRFGRLDLEPVGCHRIRRDPGRSAWRSGAEPGPLPGPLPGLRRPVQPRDQARRDTRQADRRGQRRQARLDQGDQAVVRRADRRLGVRLPDALVGRSVRSRRRYTRPARGQPEGPGGGDRLAEVAGWRSGQHG